MTRRRHRVVRRLAIAAGAWLALNAAATAAAKPGYVTYYRTFGEWAVVCAVDEPTGRKACRLSAPDPRAGGPFDDAVIRLDVAEPAGGEAVIAVRIGAVVATGRPASLTVDGHARRDAPLARTGEAVWRGAEARAIIAEMAAGRSVSIRFVRWSDAAEVERRFSLAGFAEARRTYRRRLATIEQAPR